MGAGLMRTAAIGVALPAMLSIAWGALAGDELLRLPENYA